MAKHITKIDDIEDLGWRAMFQSLCRTAFNGDEASFIADYNQSTDELDNIPFSSPQSISSEVSLRFSNLSREVTR